MSRRENLIRSVLLLFVLGIIATLVIVDRARGNDAPDSDPTPTGAPSETSSATVVPAPTKAATPTKVETDVIPTPPPGIEAIACQKLQQSVTVRVLDFNTHRSYGGISTLAGEIRAVDPDVVILQEIDRFKAGTGNIDQAAYFADSLGMDHAFGANVTAGNGDYGVAILSRFKILNIEHYLLPNAPGGEQRGLLGVGVEIGGQEVRIYATHLQNKMAGLREAQARYVAGILAGEENPIILGGDMNATSNTATLAPLMTTLVDAWSVGYGPEGTGPNGSRIDFLLASPTIEPQRAQVFPSAISDHNRLTADFVVPAATDCPTQPRASKSKGKNR